MNKQKFYSKTSNSWSDTNSNHNR